ncbi:MAG TPA: hypothetical protein VJX68_07390 [Candidatus Binatus sp.]|uniref:hypothetical protein n=1 Tax=Candidatus Binatus sp. TaxID=2811406 RepID=UPI002B4A732F|nr:hypothetical protein [Candidatus Binatus sp.]HKN13005.1 hypothetical protein [Candidatus Binatus sp.]
MQVSLRPKSELRSKIGRLAAAVGVALVIGSFAIGSARADNDHHGDNRRGDQHRDNDNRGYRGPAVVYAPQPDYYYYTPQPDYYAAPDPYYYGPGPGYDAPPQGVTLFFGL